MPGHAACLLCSFWGVPAIGMKPYMDIDECALHPCKHPHSACINKEGSVACSHKDGHIGSGLTGGGCQLQTGPSPIPTTGNPMLCTKGCGVKHSQRSSRSACRLGCCRSCGCCTEETKSAVVCSATRCTQLE